MSEPVPADELDRFAALARRRRTSLRLDPEAPVPAELIERLCAIAAWAPSHKRTWPWRFAVLTGAARRRFGEAAAAQLVAEGIDDEARLAATRAKYLRSSTVVVVAAGAHADPDLHAENRDAVAAAVQNFLLGATAAGLGSFWATGAPVRSAAVRRMCGFAPDDRIVAVIYLGWPTGEVETPTRPPAAVAHVRD